MRDVPVLSIPRVLRLVAAGARAKCGRIALRKKLNIEKRTHANQLKLTTDNVSRAPTENRQVSLVYRCRNFAGKVSFSLTLGDPRRAFQAAMLTRHVVAAA